MVVGVKRAREDQEKVALALSSSADTSSGYKKARRVAAATSGEGEFVCKTCSRAFPSFQALGGHRTSHLRGRHGLELAVGAKAIREAQRKERQHHQCHVCGLGFEMGQALGGHMRRHREEAAMVSSGGADSADAWICPGGDALQDHADEPPVLLELFV